MNITEIIGRVFGVLMNACYQLLNNHVFAILLFTAITKIILLPISMWTQKNGITMRDQIGRTLDLDKVNTAAEAVADLFENQAAYSDRIVAFMNKYISILVTARPLVVSTF